jgi:hypothetical protein
MEQFCARGAWHAFCAGRSTRALSVMRFLLVVALVLAVGYILFSILRGRPAPRPLSQHQVVSALSNALDLDDSGNHDEFDLFLGRSIADPSLESLRKECLAVISSDSKPAPGRDLGPNAEKWIRQKLVELQQQG